MTLRPEEVTSVIKKELEKYKSRMMVESIGTVIQVGDTIARITVWMIAWQEKLCNSPNRLRD